MAGVETIGQRPLMPCRLLKAAIEGDAQVLNEMLRLEEDGGHTSVSIGPATDAEIDKNLKSATYMGNTVLHVLFANDHGVLAYKVCTKDGSLLRAQNKMLETPLHYGAKGIVNREAISALIEFARSEGELVLKEVLRDRNNHGETALHVIARYANFSTIESILNKMLEGDPDCAYQVDNDGLSSLDVAMVKGAYDDVSKQLIWNLYNQRILSRICRSRANQPTALHTTLQRAEIAQKEIEVPTSAGIIGSSPIHIAAFANTFSVVKSMLSIDVSFAYLQDSDGLFPVHIAAREGHACMVLILMQHCHDFGELVDHRERNFLHVAAEENKWNVFNSLFSTSYTDTITIPFLNKILERMINTGDVEGNTPLHIAAGKGYKSLMTMIVDGGHVCTGHVRNRKGLSAFDVSMIQVKSTGNSVETQDRIEQYFQNGGRWELGLDWFKNVMTTDHDKLYALSIADRIQIMGLGAVLISTIAFAAAFTLPGGYDSNGSPVLADKYIFKAFILAIASAFIQSFICVIMLVSGRVMDLSDMTTFFYIPMQLFSGGAISIALAFGLGLYLVLAPVNKGISILIIFLAVASVMHDITPNFLFMEINFIYKWRALKKDLEEIGGIHHLMLNCLGMLRFVLPFAFIFIFAFLS